MTGFFMQEPLPPILKADKDPIEKEISDGFYPAQDLGLWGPCGGGAVEASVKPTCGHDVGAPKLWGPVGGPVEASTYGSP